MNYMDSDCLTTIRGFSRWEILFKKREMETQATEVTGPLGCRLGNEKKLTWSSKLSAQRGAQQGWRSPWVSKTTRQKCLGCWDGLLATDRHTKGMAMPPIYLLLELSGQGRCSSRIFSVESNMVFTRQNNALSWSRPVAVCSWAKSLGFMAFITFLKNSRTFVSSCTLFLQIWESHISTALAQWESEFPLPGSRLESGGYSCLVIFCKDKCADLGLLWNNWSIAGFFLRKNHFRGFQAPVQCSLTTEAGGVWNGRKLPILVGLFLGWGHCSASPRPAEGGRGTSGLTEVL